MRRLEGILKFHDWKLGNSLSDPTRRSNDVLAAFLKTFVEENHLKFFAKVRQCHLKRDVVGQFTNISPDKKYLSSTCCIIRSHQNDEVKLDELVNPNKVIADYRTDITGVSARDSEGVTCSLADVQKSMKKLLSKGTILVGHSLNNDLQALKLDHARSVLGYEIRKKGAPHNCLEDASAAMKLVLAKIENGVDKAIPLVQEDVPNSEMAKLFLHRIPKNVPTEELHKVIPGDFTIELKFEYILL
ncbi:small rna degrading nuclease 3, partial [Quercus suber]